jgi:hydroxycarboxylate dehydrogenase B
MITLTSEQISDVCSSILKGFGTPPADAKLVGDHLARANLFGHDSHGFQSINYYAFLIRRGLMKPVTDWRVIKETSSIALIDGGWGLGQVVCTHATRLAIKKARESGIGSVGILNCGHIGRLGEYTSMISEEKMIGMLFANCDPTMAPWGGMGRILGTNPMSFAFPAGSENTVMVDFASAAVAEGKIKAALFKGETIPEGWILDKNGLPTTNPADLYGPPLPPEGQNLVGAQLPAAGHKGFGLAIAVDIIAGALTGSGCGPDVKAGNGVFIQAINVESFGSTEKYEVRVDKLVREIKDSPKAPGYSEILVPGEPELRSAQMRKKSGIPVADTTWKNAVRLGKDLGIDVEAIVAQSSRH